MSQMSDAQLKVLANIIGDETQQEANTADRIRQMLVNMIDSKPNNDSSRSPVYCNTIGSKFNASAGVYPSTGGTGTSGSIKAQNIFYITGSGTLGGENIASIFSVMALVDSPGQTDANWKLNF